MAVELTSSATTIDSLPVEMLAEILLRVSTPAGLVHAAATSRSWRGAVATPEFLARYRKRHKSSTFLGLYVPRQFAGPPSFFMPDSVRLGDDDVAKDAARRAFAFDESRRYQDHRLDDDDFIPDRLVVHPDCRLLDCHNSRLLLTRGDEALEVRSPLARESILLPFPPDVADPCRLEACLLQGHDKSAASFRVVCLQHRREGRNRKARALEYDSTRKSWQDHPWETLKSNIEGTPEELMHAGHWIFCKYTGQTSAALLLDTSNMQFSVLPLPSHQRFVIGEIEDNVCCFVEAVSCADHRLRVWQLDEEKLHWDLKKDIKMHQVIGEHVGYYRPRTISNGMALLCSGTTHHHFVVDLNSSTKEKFEFHGQSAYPMQMPWPPAFSGPTANVAEGFDRDGGPASVGDARTGSDRIAACTQKLEKARELEEIDDPSPGPSVGGCDGTDPLPEAKKAAQLLHSSSIACFVPGSSTALPALMASTTAGSPNCPHQDTGCHHPERRGFDQGGGPASVGDTRTGSGEPDTIEDLFGGTLDMAPPAPPAVEPEEPLIWRSRSPFCEQSLNHDLLLQPPALASCSQQSRKRSRESKRSPEAMGPGKRNWKQKPKFLEAGSYSSSSAYGAMFFGCSQPLAAKQLWKIHVPSKVRFFLWLVMHKRCWTADRRWRRGLQASNSCIFCDQDAETIDHLLLACSYAREVWHLCLVWLRMQHIIIIDGAELLPWWLLQRKVLDKHIRQAFDCLFALVSWLLWKERNNRTFNHLANSAQQLLSSIKEESRVWVDAGYKKLLPILPLTA